MVSTNNPNQKKPLHRGKNEKNIKTLGFIALALAASLLHKVELSPQELAFKRLANGEQISEVKFRGSVAHAHHSEEYRETSGTYERYSEEQESGTPYEREYQAEYEPTGEALEMYNEFQGTVATSEFLLERQDD